MNKFVNKESRDYRAGFIEGSDSLIKMIEHVVKSDMKTEEKVKLIDASISMVNAANRIGESNRIKEEEEEEKDFISRLVDEFREGNQPLSFVTENPAFVLIKKRGGLK